MYKIIQVLLFLFGPLCFLSAQKNDIEATTISILTCAPGDQLYAIYGHNAIRIHQKNSGQDIVYNYGTFDFDTPGFAVKFMRGKLLYAISAVPFDHFIAEYNYFERSVTEQVLNLDSIQKVNIIQYLDQNLLPENRLYKYDFFMDNCATRLRDIIDKNVTSFSWDETKSPDKSFRDIIKEYQKEMPWTNFGIDLIIGAPADRKVSLSQASFIPDYLAAALSDAFFNPPSTEKLELEKTQILTFEKKDEKPNLFLSPYFLFIILLLLEINIFFRSLNDIHNKWIKRYDHFWFTLLTFASLLMIFMWFGTDHIPTRYNWNILWASPLVSIWWVFWIKKWNIKWLTYLVVGCLLLSILNAIPILNFLPQYFHPIVAIICLILCLKIWRLK